MTASSTSIWSTAACSMPASGAAARAAGRALSQQRRRHLPRCHRCCRRRQRALGPGRLRRRHRQRRPPATSTSPTSARNRLYRAAATARSPTSPRRPASRSSGWSTGCAFGDYDARRLARPVRRRLRRAGSGARCRPRRRDAQARRRAAQARAPAAQGGGMGAAYSAGAAVCTYRGEPVMCGPRGLTGAADHLFRNNGDGTFTETSRQAGVADDKGRYGFGVAWVDSTTTAGSTWWSPTTPGRTTCIATAATADSTTSAIRPARRSTATAASRRTWASPSATTTTTAATTSTSPTSPTTSTCSTTTTTARRSPTSASAWAWRTPSIPFLGWGTDFLDYDNDGWLDLLVVNGHVYPSADEMPWNTSYAQRALLFRNLAGTRFEEIGSGRRPGPDDAARLARIRRRRPRQRRRLDVVINNLDGAPTIGAQRRRRRGRATG